MKHCKTIAASYFFPSITVAHNNLAFVLAAILRAKHCILSKASIFPAKAILFSLGSSTRNNEDGVEALALLSSSSTFVKDSTILLLLLLLLLFLMLSFISFTMLR